MANVLKLTLFEIYKFLFECCCINSQILYFFATGLQPQENQTFKTLMKKTSKLNQLPGNTYKIFIRFLILFLFINPAILVYGQGNDSSDKIYHASGIITATNNGISVIPSFSLGKPALMFEFSVGGEKLSFDPQFRFGMDGKPWSFVFWWRYKFYESDKFSFHMGAHPAFLFADIAYINEGRAIESKEARRYYAGEIAPTFKISKKISISPYYLVGHGVDEGVTNSHYLTLRGSLTDLGITEHIRFAFSPQIYFLKMDADHGFYTAASFSLEHNEFPVSLASMVNVKIKSDVPSDDLLWNLSLVYKFNSTFKKR